ncbi:MAG: PQQ-binding-like beta-propeller repeat protein [Verrucomicrobiae bacterium]|nr:PQQ-binding-like beta-propeller repeat protein [Verrucomicrobiae bacterium]
MKPSLLLFFLAAGLAAAGSASANDWPGWRGPNGDGTLPDDARYPTEWSASKNIRWRAELPAPGNSSPIVSGDRVFLTVGENGGRLRSLLCFDAKSGKQLWKKTVDYGKEDVTHKTNPYCAASPVTDGKLVYAWFGNAGLHACDFNGEEAWSRDLGGGYAHIWGPNAASPVLLGGGLLLHAGPGMEAKLFALEAGTGKTIWEEDLPDSKSAKVGDFKGSWATPLVIDNGGRTEMLLGLPGRLTSFDPKTGKELWRAAGLGDLCYTNVLTGNGRAVYLCGYGGPGMAVKLPGPKEKGDLTKSIALWTDPPKGKNQNPQRIGSGLIVGDHLFLLNEPGIAECVEVETGRSLWKEKLSGKSWSSLNRVGGKLYVNDQRGTTFVFEPDAAGLKLVATNEVDPGQHTNASLAFAGGTIFLRTDAFLYAIE